MTKISKKGRIKMKIKPTLEIARRSVQQSISEFNEKYTSPMSKTELIKLQKGFETSYKKEHGENFKNHFHEFCLLQVIINIAKTLNLHKIGNIELSDEQGDLCAKALYETWSQ